MYISNKIVILRTLYTKYMRKKNVIGIDPDCESSGFAYINGNEINVWSLSFIEVIRMAKKIWIETKGEVFIVVEGGWMNKGHWHNAKSIPMAYNIGNKVGRNHETGRKIVEVLEALNIKALVVTPFRKIWSKGKISTDELNRQLKLHKINPIKRCNQDIRDAALLALGYLI